MSKILKKFFGHGSSVSGALQRMIGDAQDKQAADAAAAAGAAPQPVPVRESFTPPDTSDVKPAEGDMLKRRRRGSASDVLTNPPAQYSSATKALLGD